jgi:hypothetical protein
MSRFKSDVGLRRKLVAQFLLRKVPTRDIAVALQNQGWPISQSTVWRDKQAVEAAWQKEAVAALALHKARQLAMLAEVQRIGWQESPPNLAIILRAIETEIKLLGTAGQHSLETDDQVGLFLTGIVQVLRGYVSDQRTLASIGADLRALTIIDAGE